MSVERLNDGGWRVDPARTSWDILEVRRRFRVTAAAIAACLTACGCSRNAGSNGSGQPPNAPDVAAPDAVDFRRPTVLFDFPFGYPSALHVDDDFVYWSTPNDNMSVRRGPKNGGEVVTFGPWGGDYAADLFVTDQEHIYWLYHDHINKVPKAGGATTEISLGSDFRWGLIAGDAGTLYFVDAACKRMGRVSKDGSNLQTWLVAGVIDNGGVTNLLVDDTHVYCGNYNQLFRLANQSNDAPGLMLTISDSFGGMDQGATNLYWLETLANRKLPQTVKTMPKAGGSHTVLGTLNQGGGGPLLADEKRRVVYWVGSNSVEGFILSLSMEGGTPARIVEKRPLSGVLRQDEDFLYWIERPVGGGAGIFKMAKP